MKTQRTFESVRDYRLPRLAGPMRDVSKTSKASPIILPVVNGSNNEGHLTGKGHKESSVAKTRRTEKTVEIHEFYVIRTASGSLPPLCSECQTADAIMVAPEQAAVIAAVPVRTVYRRVETEMVHYKEGPGSMLVCVKSLLNS